MLAGSVELHHLTGWDPRRPPAAVCLAESAVSHASLSPLLVERDSVSVRRRCGVRGEE